MLEIKWNTKAQDMVGVSYWSTREGQSILPFTFKFLAHDDNFKRHQFSAVLVLLALDFTEFSNIPYMT